LQLAICFSLLLFPDVFYLEVKRRKLILLEVLKKKAFNEARNLFNEEFQFMIIVFVYDPYSSIKFY